VYAGFGSGTSLQASGFEGFFASGVLMALSDVLDSSSTSFSARNIVSADLLDVPLGNFVVLVGFVGLYDLKTFNVTGLLECKSKYTNSKNY
jgi:hypothetical protein